MGNQLTHNLSTLCAPYNFQERLWQNFASKPKNQGRPSEAAGIPKAKMTVDVSGVTCAVAYDIQGK